MSHFVGKQNYEALAILDNIVPKAKDAKGIKKPSERILSLDNISGVSKTFHKEQFVNEFN